MLGRRKTKQPVCALLTFLMAWASGQSQPRLASTRHYGSLSMPTFRRQGPPVSKWNGTEKGLQTVAERLESSRGLSESRNLREIAREQSFSVKQRVKISCCERGGGCAATRNHCIRSANTGFTRVTS